jgi:hypothetical protein
VPEISSPAIPLQAPWHVPYALLDHIPAMKVLMREGSINNLVISSVLLQ